jgi:hypothetical protein
MADSICKLDHRANEIKSIKLKRIGEVNGALITADNGMAELLAAELRERQEITDVIINEDCLQINYALDYGYIPLDRPGDFLTIVGLIGCDLEDFHFLHTDVDHDLATIVELNKDTLTEQGKTDWADILGAKVERIYQGYYGIQADISGCEPERLRDFSYLLSGRYSVSDTNKWIKDGTADPKETDTIRRAERDFARQMREIDGCDPANTAQWIEKARVLAKENSDKQAPLSPLEFQIMLNEYADGFTLLNDDYEDCVAEIYNGKAVFTPRQLQDVAEWLCNGGDIDGAQRLAEMGLPISDEGASDESESNGVTMM